MQKYKEISMTVDDALSTAFGAITELAESMREAFDNTPESLQQSAVGEARDTAASALEDISEVEVPEVLQGEKFSFKHNEPVRTSKQAMKLSRSTRRDDALQLLGETTDYLTNLSDDKEQSAEVRDAAGELVSDIENMVSEAEAVEFPGRNG